MERGIRERGVPLTELEAGKIPWRRCVERKGGMRRGAVDGPAFDEEGKAYPLARDVAKGASANVSWEGPDVLDYNDLRQYLNSERLSVLPVKGRDFSINTKRLIRLTVRGEFNLREGSWGLFQKLEPKTVMDMPHTCDREELLYAERLDKLY